MRALIFALLAACSSDWVSRETAARKIADAFCDRAVSCGRIARSAFTACEITVFFEICRASTCDNRAADADAVDACVDACRELGCTDTQRPKVCAEAF